MVAHGRSCLVFWRCARTRSPLRQTQVSLVGCVGQDLWRMASQLLTAQHSSPWSLRGHTIFSCSRVFIILASQLSQSLPPGLLPQSLPFPSHLLLLGHHVCCFVASASDNPLRVSQQCCILLTGAISVCLLPEPPRGSGWDSSFCLASGLCWTEFHARPPPRSLVSS